MTLTVVIWSLVVGLIVGALARFLVPGRDSMGLIATALLGIAGAFVGAFLANLLWHHQPAVITLQHGYTLQPGGLISSVIGAVLLLVVARLGRRRSAW